MLAADPFLNKDTVAGLVSNIFSADRGPRPLEVYILIQLNYVQLKSLMHLYVRKRSTNN